MKPTFNKTFNNSNKINIEKQESDNKKRKKSRSKDPSKDYPITAGDPIKETGKENKKRTEEQTENIQQSQIISGYFLNEKSYKELVIQRLNNFLYGVLIFLVLLCFASYYFVSCSEVDLNQISRSTLELNYENEELQNKVDMLQSYYNIDKAVSKANILERAKQVMEVDAVETANMNFTKNSKNPKNSIVVSF